MDNQVLDETTRILTEFARTKYTAQVLDVQGPVHEGAIYRWRLVSNRHKDVTVLLSTKKAFLGKLSVAAIEVYGLGATKALGPNLGELQEYLSTAELSTVR